MGGKVFCNDTSKVHRSEYMLESRVVGCRIHIFCSGQLSYPSQPLDSERIDDVLLDFSKTDVAVDGILDETPVRLTRYISGQSHLSSIRHIAQCHLMNSQPAELRWRFRLADQLDADIIGAREIIELAHKNEERPCRLLRRVEQAKNRAIRTRQLSTKILSSGPSNRNVPSWLLWRVREMGGVTLWGQHVTLR